MKTLTTLTGNKFQFKGNLDEELIVYPYNKGQQPQMKFALAITLYTTNLIKDAIKQKEKILMGASRDKPPKGSLGDLLKIEQQTPQQLSYLIPILIEAGYCDFIKEGNAFVIRYKGV